MGVLITSMVKNNPGLHFVFHIFSFAFSEDDRRRINRLEELPGVTVRLNVLSADSQKIFEKFPGCSANLLPTFIRLLIPEKLQGIKRVLYLDADILCLGNLRELLSINIDDCIAAVVHDDVDTTAKTQISALELQHGKYFNAGVIYINIDNWIAANIQNTVLNLLSTRRLVFGDQDALNIALDGRVKYIDEKWNYRYHLVARLSAAKTSFLPGEKPVFMHFTGPTKPWHDWCLHEAKSIFLGYQALSPWSDVPLDKPKTARELKLYSRFLIRQNHRLKGIYWHLKYLGARLAQQLK